MKVCTPLLLSALASGASAFTAGLAQQRHKTALHVGATLDWNSVEDEMFLYQRAQACADSDSCSLEDAKAFLGEVIHVQSDCVSGVLVGSNVCDDVITPATIVASLREKIEKETKKVRLVTVGSNVVTASMGVMVVSACVAGMAAVNPDVATFTPQEWFWAIRDGYLPTMVEYYFKHGGLLTDVEQQSATPFALQEWWWAIKGGYFPTMAEHFFRNGGLATTADYQLEAAAIAPQEWFWAARDGYLPTMLEQNFQSGGLPTDYSSETVPFTPQELVWAARDGYLPQLAEHYFRNGGL